MIKIPAVIISTPNSGRLLPLIDKLSATNTFEPILLTATMGENLKLPSEYETRKELENYGRTLTQNERACAISHTQARDIIAESPIGGIIFEDDARILDLLSLEKSTVDFLLKYGETYSALGLVQYSRFKKVSRPSFQIPRFRRLLSEVPLAVATVLTKNAARKLTESASSSSQIADWPSSGCKYYFLAPGCVRHGDESSGTVIGDSSTRILGNYPPILTRQGIKLRQKRLLQKLDTHIISYHQSK